MSAPRIATVVIGRNEGDRLIRCLEALRAGQQTGAIVYVDSGSSDGSVATAAERGARTIELDLARPFTAARARNRGLAELEGDLPDYVQVVDGDCELRPGWIATATAFLEDHDDVAMVAGRLRERHPEASLWNRLTDGEWETPTGEVAAVGGIALMRARPVLDIGGYREGLIAGEEPELCLRLRAGGWRIWRLPDEMGLHDVAMTRATEWWRRTKRGGYAFAEGASLHSGVGFRRRETWRALLWGAGVPLLAFAGLLATSWSLVILLAWPLQVLRLVWTGYTWERALFLTIGKVAEAQGVLVFWLGQLTGPQRRLIKYK